MRMYNTLVVTVHGKQGCQGTLVTDHSNVGSSISAAVLIQTHATFSA